MHVRRRPREGEPLKKYRQMCPESAKHPFCCTVIEAQKGLPITGAGPSRAAPSVTGLEQRPPREPIMVPAFRFGPVTPSNHHGRTEVPAGVAKALPTPRQRFLKGLSSLVPSCKVWLCLLCSQSGFLFRRGMSFLKGYKCDSKGFLDIKWLIKRRNV